MAIVGVESDRGAALAGRPITSMLSNDVANPLIIADEICNARTITTTRGANHAFANALLSLLEPATALNWEAHTFACVFHVTYLMGTHVKQHQQRACASPEPLPSVQDP